MLNFPRLDKPSFGPPRVHKGLLSRIGTSCTFHFLNPGGAIEFESRFWEPSSTTQGCQWLEPSFLASSRAAMISVRSRCPRVPDVFVKTHPFQDRIDPPAGRIRRESPAFVCSAPSFKSTQFIGYQPLASQQTITRYIKGA